MAIVSRLQLNHPALGTTGGAGLHASIEDLYEKIGDNMNDRWFAISDFDQTETVDLLHNFETDIGNINYDIWQYTGSEWVLLTEQTTPLRSQFSIVEKTGFEDTTLQITNNSSTDDLIIAVSMTMQSLYLAQDDIKDVDITSVTPEDGQALVFEASSGKFKPGASGDASFKLQSVTDPNAVIKGGFLILDDGRELATFDTTYGVDLTVSLDTIFGGNPVDATTYYLYIDKNLLGDVQTETATGRKLYQVTESEMVLATVSPEAIDLARYYPIGLVRSADTGTVWSGTGSAFRNLAVRRHQVPSVNVSPLKETITRTVETVGASSTQLQGGHVLDVNSFPSTIAPGNTSIWNMVNANTSDNYSTRNLTQAGGSFTGSTGILGVALSSSNNTTAVARDDSSLAFFNTSTAFVFGGWFKPTSYAPGAPGQLIGKWVSSSRGARITLDSTNFNFEFSSNGTLVASFSVPTAGLSGWQHLAMKFDGTTIKGYLNGALVGSAVSAIFNSTNKFSIGAKGDAGDPYSGDIDECFYTTLALSDDDIRKLASSKLTWTNTLSAANQRIEAEYTYGDFKSQIDSDFIVDKDDDKLYADFSGLPSTAQVSVKMYDAGLSASVIPIRSYDATFLTTPGATIAHGLPSMPTAFAVLHNENADGKWVPLNAENFLRADDTNIYTAGFGALTIDATHPLRIVAAIGQTSAAWAKDFSDNLTPVYKTKTSAYTAVKGDRIFADTSGGAFTITLPPSAAYGDVVEFYDPKDTWDTANVTVARNGHNINGAASDLTLDVEGGFTKLVYFDVTQGWRTY